ncbi:alkene reductase [Pelobacter propionicus]|uniref:NADH:flavin oxidoreductase/NADH oxidase n=1 Tax=Pelobacter propionicus (strain DSM 2379 / NBRC 103807 / OttBd1) TaxID=338966 RepID=A1AN11_PELPD|nr:alkene reductase [Pelobacter propionicus]ABK98731.1 NADH:flavin oxidoreductase/NADH oxidase [Pelobacter propionicus DSM 2379]
MPTLFDPITVGALRLPNRIIMAPMTRARASADTRVPLPMMAEYYSQRATAGLIISEATVVDRMGVGYEATPGIWSHEQVEGWKSVTKAVHDAGGRIFLQLWHVGRISDPSFLGGKPPVSASAIAAKGHVSLLRPKRPYPVPHALELHKIPQIIAAYRNGAINAKTACFDGVEIHGANGYLLDQFLQDSTNRRTDAYGGSRENRARLMLEVTDAVVEVWGAGRVGMHLAPRADFHDMGDSDRLATFTYVARELGKRGLAFICAREARLEDSIGPLIREAFGGAYIANESFTRETAEQALADGVADAVAFGKAFIANPDLVARFAANAPLNAWDDKTFYVGGAKGYIDYTTLPHAI